MTKPRDTAMKHLTATVILSRSHVNVNVNQKILAWLKQPRLLQSPRERSRKNSKQLATRPYRCVLPHRLQTINVTTQHHSATLPCTQTGTDLMEWQESLGLFRNRKLWIG